MGSYVSLHNHSQKSLLDGMIKINNLVARTLELNQSASVITDHGNMYTIVDHFKYAQKAGQKPIAGIELYTVKDMTVKSKSEGESESNTTRNHLILLAKNKAGYQKLCRITSMGYTDGFYYRPRVDDSVLERFLDKQDDDVICLSACVAGIIDQLIIHDKMEEAEQKAKYYQNLFHGNFWLEIQPTTMYDQMKANIGLMDLSKRLGIPLVVTTDAHYLHKEDKSSHDVLLCLQSGSTMSNPNRWKFPGNTYYVMSRDEVSQAFKIPAFDYKYVKYQRNKDERYKYVYSYEGDLFNSTETAVDGYIETVRTGTIDYNTLDQNVVEQAIDETEHVASLCNVELDFSSHFLPKIQIPVDNPDFKNWLSHKTNKGKPNEDYLKFLCIKGLKKKGLTNKVYRDRLYYELGVINDMDFPDYFLIYYDIAKFCHDNNIPLGPGRGCFKANNLVKTNHGLKEIQNVDINDDVIANDEQWHNVIDTHVYDVDEPLVTLDCGDKLIDGATLDHKIYAIKKIDYDYGIRTPQWYSANELQIGDYICEG